MKLKFPFFGILYGAPEHPTELKYRTDTIYITSGGERERQVDTHLVIHPVRSWYGISFGDGFFFGMIRMQPRINDYSIQPVAADGKANP